MNGPEIDLAELQQAIDAMPFLTERSFVELAGYRPREPVKEPDELLKLLKDIPDYCTVAFVQEAQFEPDGRLKLQYQGLRGIASSTLPSSPGELVRWIARRFAAVGKRVEMEAAQHDFLFLRRSDEPSDPGDRQSAAYAKGDRVTVADVDAVATTSRRRRSLI